MALDLRCLVSDKYVSEVVPHAFNPSILEIETGGSLELYVSLVYIPNSGQPRLVKSLKAKVRERANEGERVRRDLGKSTLLGYPLPNGES